MRAVRRKRRGFIYSCWGEGGGDVKDRASWGKQKTGSGPSVWEGLFSMCERVIR